MFTAARLDAISVIHQRRAIRSYTPQKVERATIEQLIDAAIHAPTAVHREPWAFVVIQDKERLRHYSDRAKALGGDVLLSRERAACARAFVRSVVQDILRRRNAHRHRLHGARPVR